MLQWTRRLHSPHTAVSLVYSSHFVAVWGSKKLGNMQLYKAGHITQTIDHCNSDYTTAFHLAGRVMHPIAIKQPVSKKQLTVLSDKWF